MGLPKIRAPELPENLEWFNIDRPLTIAEQLGKLVLLDFWTYCCINCMHVLPDLRYLEEKYPDSLTVIGLHSPKFTNERVGDQVQKAINRYSIQHPVANDPGLTVWRQYGVHAWPTLVLIDTEGNVVAVLPGEGNRQRLDQLIAQQIEIAKQNGTYQPRRLSAKMSPETSTSKLLFPGKLFIDKEKLYVSDSGHQRVLELDPQGKVLRSFGTEAVAKVRFNNPQGLIKVGQILYVADTDNHCIRSIDLVSGEVATLAGNGKQGGYLNSFQPVSLQTSLNSPWDLACVNNILFIAMAGSHQIWCVDLALQVLRLFSGHF